MANQNQRMKGPGWVLCPHCKKKTPHGEKFCVKCGKDTTTQKIITTTNNLVKPLYYLKANSSKGQTSWQVNLNLFRGSGSQQQASQGKVLVMDSGKNAYSVSVKSNGSLINFSLDEGDRIVRFVVEEAVEFDQAGKRVKVNPEASLELTLLGTKPPAPIVDNSQKVSYNYYLKAELQESNGSWNVLATAYRKVSETIRESVPATVHILEQGAASREVDVNQGGTFIPIPFAEKDRVLEFSIKEVRETDGSVIHPDAETPKLKLPRKDLPKPTRTRRPVNPSDPPGVTFWRGLFER